VLGARETPLYEAQSSDLMRSTVMLAYIRLLYDVEREARDMKLNGEGTPGAASGQVGTGFSTTSRPIWSANGPTCCRRAPKGKRAATRCRTGKALTRYCEDGDLEIDNNGAERSLRGIAVGRRNWDVLWERQRWTDSGGPDQLHHHGAKDLGIDPFAYAARHLRTHQHPSRQPARRAASRPMACCAAGSPQPLERLLPGICSGARMTFFCPRYLGD